MKIFRLFIIICFGLFLLAHLTFTLLYTLPPNLVSCSLKQKSSSYINPLFNQGWALFAPVPQQNKKVYVSYLQMDNTWGKWQDPFEKYLRVHQSERLSANGKVVLILSSTMHYLYYENEEKFKTKKIVSGDTTSGYYKVLRNEVERKLLWNYKENKKIKLIIEYTNADCENKQTHYIFYSN